MTDEDARAAYNNDIAAGSWRELPRKGNGMTDYKALRETLERRGICIYRDGRHYIPVFTRGGGSAEDEARAIFAALRQAEVVPEVEGFLTLIAGHTGKTLIGDGTYSEGAHDAFSTLGEHAEFALARLQSAKAPT